MNKCEVLCQECPLRTFEGAAAKTIAADIEYQWQVGSTYAGDLSHFEQFYDEKGEKPEIGDPTEETLQAIKDLGRACRVARESGDCTASGVPPELHAPIDR